MRILLTLILAILLINSFSNNSSKIDSLIQLLNKTNHDTTVIKLYLEIASNYDRVDLDSSLYWNKKANSYCEKVESKYKNKVVLDKLIFLKSKSLQGFTYVAFFRDDMETAKKYLNEAISLVKSIHDNKSLNILLSNLCLILEKEGKYDEAISEYKKNIDYSGKIKDEESVAINKCNLGKLYMDLGDYSKATSYLLDALNIYIKKNLELKEAICYHLLAVLNFNQSNYQKALEYEQKAVEKREMLNDKMGLASSYTSLGNIYSQIHNNKLSIVFYEKALNLYNSLEMKSGQLMELNNIGSIYQQEKNFTKALEYYIASKKICEEINATNHYCTVLYNIADVYNELNNFNEAIKYCNKSLSIAKSLNLLNEQKAALKILSEIYEKKGDFKNAFHYMKEYKEMNDSIFDIDKTKQAKELETRYESEKKQLEIEKLEKDKNLQKEVISRQTAENKRQQLIIFSTIGFIILISTFSLLLIRLFIQKKKANKRLSLQNEEIKQQKEEIIAQRDEIESQRDLVLDQKNHIEQIHLEVSQSIDYAKRLQSAVLPETEILADFVSEHFILYNPKDKVSGDFYWWAKVENQIVVAVADCTGHGVPGAFMSMLGSSYLREIVIKEYITNPSVILRRLRKEVVKTLKQKGEYGEQKDGMDICLISFDSELTNLQFAGANNPLYIVRKSNIDSNKNENNDLPDFILDEVKGDKMPIAIYEKMDSFTNHSIEINRGDTVYLFSDGYADQFGGPKGKKFMYKPFKELLISIADKPLQSQKTILQKTILEWKGHLEQIDDITILGIRF